ncbi:MAG: TIGR00289 family protein [Theionarchaea archaeon]|nr:TIGR00289 family protein [Theionarchaea archaeon]
MKLGALFSGGKDSAYALWKAMETDEVVCLISVVSKNEESYMFHTPNIGITEVQAKATGLPLVKTFTEGVKEEELKDLKRVIEKANEMYGIEGVVTGAVESVYQATRIQRVCDELDLWCFNPLWLKDQIELLREIVENQFQVIISGIFAYPLDESWLGKMIDNNTIEKLIELKERYQISPSGEGGEIETTVLDAPFFMKRILVEDFEVKIDKYSGIYIMKNVELVEK